MSRRNRLINYLALEAAIMTILSFALYPTEYWIWGIVYSLLGMMFLVAYFTVNFEYIMSHYIDTRKDKEPMQEAIDSMYTQINSTKEVN